MNRSRRTAPLAALLVVALVTSVGLVAAATKPKVWIDQPLPGAVLPVGPTAVTIHAAAPLGIVKVRALVDGLPVAELPAPTGDLVTIPWTWPVETAGERLLTVVAEGTDGLSSDPVSVVVTFVAPRQPEPSPSAVPSPGESAAASATPPPSTSPSAPPRSTPGPTAGPTPAPTPKPTPAPTPKPTPSPRPTPPPCVPAAPLLLLPENGTGVDDPPTFEWLVDSPGCEPTGHRIQVSSSRTFDSIVMSATLPADQTYWTPDAGGLVPCETYAWRVRSRAPNGDFGPWSEIWTFYIRSRTCP